MKIQVTLTAEGAKRLIAHAIAGLPEVQSAMANGKILLKGSTTVSAVSEILCGTPLRICGRIDSLGTATANKKTEGAHSLMLVKGKPENIDSCFAEAAENMEPGDICIAGANLVDIDGRAAIMAGSPLGGAPLRVLASLQTEGVKTIIAAGLEKYAPCCLDDSLAAASRKGIGFAMGMASGLVPIAGQVINEVDAAYILGAEEVCVIGRGGIAGCEGGTTLAVTVKDDCAEDFFETVREANRLGASAVSGEKESLASCLATHCGPTGAGHKSCCYRAERLKNRSGE